MRHSYPIRGMHCTSCVAKIRDALEKVDGVTAAVVTLDPPRAEVEMTEHLPTERLNAAAESAGDYHLAGPSDDDLETHAGHTMHDVEQPTESLFPLFLIVGYLLGVVLLVAATTSDWRAGELMRHFMAGFFLVFSFFKLLDLPGFANTFRGYDLLARSSRAYAYAYPFIELGLGVAYLLNAYPVVTHGITLVVMGVGAVGVLRALLDQKAIRCACLGTALNLPMTKVTLVEDLTMAVMAAAMLVTGLVR